MDRLLGALGVDAGQWRALTRAYLLMDLRKGGGVQPSDPKRRRWSPDLPYAGLVIGSLLNSIIIAILVFVLEDPFTATVLMVTMAAMNSAMLLLVDFTGFVVSTHDYWIVGPRPVASRTYFAARIAAVLVYVSTAAVVMSLAPSVMLFFWHPVGITGALAAIVATVLCCVAAAAGVITLYTFLVAQVHPRRLGRALSSLQLASSTLSLAGFYLVIRSINGVAVRQVSIADQGWIWLVPVSWFASIVTTVIGAGGAREHAAAVAAVILTVAVLALAAGRLSFEFAERLSAASTSAERSRKGLLGRIPGFREGEAYAIATLVRAQFRYDMRFRFAILSIVPVTIFYIFLGLEDGALRDPFSGRGGPTPVYLAVTLLPLTLHSTLRYSEHWRAAWIFFASPADPARLLIAAKNFVAIFFLGGYLLLMSAVWAWFYDAFWHALVHAAIIGTIAHMLLQWAVLLSPSIPFAAEPRTAEQSGRVMKSFFVASMGAGIGPLLLPFIYRRGWTTIAFGILLAGATVMLELLLRRRAREEMLHLEFRS